MKGPDLSAWLVGYVMILPSWDWKIWTAQLMMMEWIPKALQEALDERQSQRWTPAAGDGKT